MGDFKVNGVTVLGATKDVKANLNRCGATATNTNIDFIKKDMAKVNVLKYKEAGVLTEKKALFGGNTLEFDIEKYKQITGKDVKVGEIKELFGLNDDVLAIENNLAFKQGAKDAQGNIDAQYVKDLSHSGDKNKIKFPESAVGLIYDK